MVKGWTVGGYWWNRVSARDDAVVCDIVWRCVRSLSRSTEYVCTRYPVIDSIHALTGLGKSLLRRREYTIRITFRNTNDITCMCSHAGKSNPTYSFFAFARGRVVALLRFLCLLFGAGWAQYFAESSSSSMQRGRIDYASSLS